MKNANTELMIAILFVAAPKGMYKDNESIGTSAENARIWTMMDVCA